GVRPAQGAGVTATATPAAPAAQRQAKPAPVLTAAAPAAAVKPAEKKTAEPPMDAAPHEIYSKETAGHLAIIREFIAACPQAGPPYVVPEDLHRAGHALGGTAKTAGARQGSKVAEPLNRYIRKLYDNSIGLAQAGLDALKDSVEAIQQVVDHINEDTG